ncbi:hypothetical protein CQU01_24720 [Cerasibacillus quisquiliarum]|uniref:Uncharacterized protein n=1 Tax=Cerasibacillus quisquiliarum TaxID=227865 RepID=A0A511V000_9BACI|nr:hypothetical protein CQU01_24720 [Cerasibacillus quisquiliarum]
MKNIVHKLQNDMYNKLSSHSKLVRGAVRGCLDALFLLNERTLCHQGNNLKDAKISVDF